MPTLLLQKALGKERWLSLLWSLKTVLWLMSMVNVHVDNVRHVCQPVKDQTWPYEWHDDAVPGLDSPDPVLLALEMRQAVRKMKTLRLTLVNGFTGSVELASVMRLNSSVATLVLAVTCLEWTWRLVNLFNTNMVGVWTALPNSIRFGINLKGLILSMRWLPVLHQMPGNIRLISFASKWWHCNSPEEKFLGDYSTWFKIFSILEKVPLGLAQEGHYENASWLFSYRHDQLLQMWSHNQRTARHLQRWFWF